MSRPPLPPFDHDSATLKVRLAEDGWNSRNPARVALAYTEDSVWRNRSTFVTGREAIVDFLAAKWQREQDYRLIKGLCSGLSGRGPVPVCAGLDHRVPAGRPVPGDGVV